MKKTLSVLFALLMSCITASAQIQNGYVRSQGTSYNRTGSPLKGARVFVKGLNGAKVTAPNGTFNFNLGGGKTQFCISSVTLKGYTLLSPLAPAYNVGKAAVEIVMQSREERIQNEARISKVIEERITKSYNAKTRELQKKITSLEKALSDKKKNSDELETQIRSLKEQLGNLDNQYLKRNELIDKMVEEYVNLDYATMNNRKAELCSYIETGELEKADSLLNTIDINKEMNDIKTLNRDIEEKESMLAKEKEIRKNKIETACMYWRGKYDIAIQNMQYDSAAVYVKNLADVDTCNFENVFDCANFLHKQNCFKEAEIYYTKLERKLHTCEPTLVALLYNNLATLYFQTNRFKQSEGVFKATLAVWERLANVNPIVYEPDIALLYENLANVYLSTNRFKESENAHMSALAIFKRLAKENPKTYESKLAASYNNLANLYMEAKRFQEGETMLIKAIAIQESLAKDDPNTYEPDLALTYASLANIYRETGQFVKCEKRYKMALGILKLRVKNNPKAYNPYIARLYNDLAILYDDTQKFKESENMHKAAIAILEHLVKESPNAYEPDLAQSYYNLGKFYKKVHRTNESEYYTKAALEIHERLSKYNNALYEPNLAQSYLLLALLYYNGNRFMESEEMHKKALKIYEHLTNKNPNAYKLNLALTYHSLAILYRDIQRFKESEEMQKCAIVIYEHLVREIPNVYDLNLAISYYSIALLYGKNQCYEECKKNIKAAINIYERLYKETTNEDIQCMFAESYGILASLYYDNLQIKESEEMYKKCIIIYERLYESNSQKFQKRLSNSYYRLGVSMIKNNNYQDAIIQFERYIKLINYINKDETDMSLYTSSLCYLVDLYSNEKNYTKAYSYNEVLIPLLKVNYEENAQRWKTEYNNKALNQSFYANLLGKFKEGEQYSLEAIEIDSTQHIAYTNLAAALLFQGKFEEAEKLYLEYKDEFKNSFIDDFAEFERLGVIPEERKADVERIKAILNE